MTTTTKQQGESLRERFEAIISTEHPRVKTERDYKCVLRIMQAAYDLDRPTVDMRGVEEAASQQSTIGDKSLSEKGFTWINGYLIDEVINLAEGMGAECHDSKIEDFQHIFDKYSVKLFK